VIWAAGSCAYPQVRFGRLFVPLSRPVPPNAEMVTAYTDGSVTLRSNRRRDGYHEARDMSGHQGVEPGDLVVHGLDILRGSVGVSDSRGAISSVCIVCAPRMAADPRYVAYVIRAEAYSGLPRALARGVREGGADFRRWETLADLPIPLPAVGEQQAIADYLDRETARIDALIATKDRLREAIDERLLAQVSVSTGASTVVDANDLPPGWKMLALRRCLASIQYGIGDASSPDGRIAVLGMANVQAGEVTNDVGGYVDDVDPTLMLSRDDLLFNRTNSRELVGKVGLVRAVDQPTTFASYLVRLRVNGLASPSYLNYLLNTNEVLGLARSLALPSIGQANLNPNRYSAIRIPLPPLKEQTQIVQVLDELRVRASTIRSTLRRQVLLLQERRQALITAAVTGQIDVPVAA
jgi:type I restriction enzyme S subunit